MSKETVIYDAQAGYMANTKENAGPRNVPANLMSKIRATSLSQLVAGQEEAALINGLSGSLLQWNSYTKLEKIEKIAELGMGEIKALLASEDDNEVLLIMLNRKKEIEKQRKE